MASYFAILCGIVVVLLPLYLYKWYTDVINYWKKRNVPGPRPHLLFGNLTETFLMKLSISDCVKKLYDEYKHEPLFGIFDKTTPVIVVNDLDLAKDVLIKDFSLFVERGMLSNKKIDPLSEHLFLLEAERWRPMRANLSPVFTSGKLKEMFPLMVECSTNLEKYLANVAAKGEPVDCRDIAAKFTTDVIGNCAFGINTSALEDEASVFRRMGKQITAPSVRMVIRNYVRQAMPHLYRLFGNLFGTKELHKFFTNIVVSSIKHRKENNVYRPDFINTLMELRDHPEKMPNVELTDTLLASQAFVFFMAGFETSSSTIAHALYELAQNHEIQDKLREEIKQSDEKHGKVLKYDRVKDMKYLDKVFKETLRKYPILSMLMRQSLGNYTFRGTKITIPKGTRVWIPVYGIQLDSDIYPNPTVFDPERFDDEAAAARHPMSYLPFGDGPRNCIGARFANFQTKVGIITILRDYKVEVCEKTTIPYKSEPKSFLLGLKGGVQLKVIKLQS